MGMMGMLIEQKCKVCGKNTFEVNTGNYYACSEHQWSDEMMVCISCFNNGNKSCDVCKNILTYHDGNKVSKWATDNEVMF